MATMTIRIPDAKHQRLRLLAQRTGVSLNKLVYIPLTHLLEFFDKSLFFNPCKRHIVNRLQINKKFDT
jgi:hypothetical protein